MPQDARTLVLIVPGREQARRTPLPAGRAAAFCLGPMVIGLLGLPASAILISGR